MNPIPKTMECPNCGHPTCRFGYFRGATTTGILWWKRTFPPVFVYRCHTCSHRRSYTREVLNGRKDVTEQDRA